MDGAVDCLGDGGVPGPDGRGIFGADKASRSVGRADEAGNGGLEKRENTRGLVVGEMLRGVVEFNLEELGASRDTKDNVVLR